ncbi:MAG: uroporphyrinogen decarboxylase family protein [Limisphaerales bacterium]
MNGREHILALLDGKGVDRLPVMPITMMFAARQLGVSYRKYSNDYCSLVEGQISTAEKFGFDYVNTMSDPAREAADCGAKVEYFDDQPAALDGDEALLADKKVLSSLKIPDPLGGGRMTTGIHAIALYKKRVSDKAIEGWVEGPCAEGADLRGINTLMLDFFDDPTFVRDLFEFIVAMELRFARLQIEAGADIIGVGDAAASLVGPEIYKEFVWPFEKKLVDGIHAMGGRVRLHICGNTSSILKKIGELQCDIVDLDSMVSIEQARAAMGHRQVLLGNANPVTVVRAGSPEQVFDTLEACAEAASPNYIIGAGCEIPGDTAPENVSAFAEFSRHYKPKSN